MNFLFFHEKHIITYSAYIIAPISTSSDFRLAYIYGIYINAIFI